jgi:hypothetical protein
LKPKVIVKELPLDLDKTQESERLEAVLKNAKRIILLLRELEVTALDMGFYSKALSRGSFPRSYVNEIGSQLEHGITELSRIHKGWQEIFIEEVKND